MSIDDEDEEFLLRRWVINMGRVHLVIKHNKFDDDGQCTSESIVHKEKEAKSVDGGRRWYEEACEEIGNRCDQDYTGEVIMAWFDHDDGDSTIIHQHLSREVD